MTSNRGHRATNKYDGVKVFSATMAKTRAQLSHRIDQWLADHPELQVVDTVVTQSSDASFHCLTITVFYSIHA